MARKTTDPTKPTVNKDGKDSYPIHTIGDLAVLYHHLPPEKRELLLKDLANGLQKGAEALDKANGLVRPLFKAAIRLTTIQWVDDDKGRVTVNAMMREGDEPFFSQEL